MAFVGSFAISDLGQLYIGEGLPVDEYSSGVPRTQDGSVLCQFDQLPLPGDAFVSGVRIGPLGGMYVTETP